MLKGFNLYRTLSKYQYEELGMSGDVYANVIDVKYWPQGALNTILASFKEAYAAIEPLKSIDPDKYNLLRERICLEELAFRKIDLQLYPGTYARSLLESELQRFKKDCLDLQIAKWGEQVGSITLLFEKLGIN